MIDRSTIRPTSCVAVVLLCAFMLYGCDDNGIEAATEHDNPAPIVDTGPHWQQLGNAVVLPADAPQNNAQLASAIDRARESLPTARTRWSQADATARRRWAVKWAAPRDDGSVEYLWVHPTHWSPFRVEGTLLNEPVQPLLVGAGQGDAVSFADEEICDWIHLPTPGNNAPPEGGFTNSELSAPEQSPQ